MTRRPPRSPPFPNTPLSRSPRKRACDEIETRSRKKTHYVVQTVPAGPGARKRSEEHTSELQSRQYLVCRLLLEKKKNQRVTPTRLQTLLPTRRTVAPTSRSR